MTPARVLNWALMGTARINRAVIPPLRASARNRLVGVASRSADRARAYAAEWGIDRSWGSYADLLADPGIDVVYIALPNHLHAEWTVKAVQAGKHVLCEKPLATHVADVDAIIAAAAVNHRVVAEAFMYRHHPQTAFVKRLATDGTIGELRLFRGSFRFPLTRPDDTRWTPEMGGGSLWDVGCYPVSFARYVAGCEPVEAIGWQRTTPGGVDETFAGQLVFPGGVCALFDSSFCAPFAAEFDIVGTEATLRLRTPYKPGLDPLIDVTDADGQTRVVQAEGQELYSGELEDLASAALDGTPPRMSLADSRGNAAALVALYESARTGRPASIRR
jgi:predicted dehydrogenase